MKHELPALLSLGSFAILGCLPLLADTAGTRVNAGSPQTQSPAEIPTNAAVETVANPELTAKLREAQQQLQQIEQTPTVKRLKELSSQLDALFQQQQKLTEPLQKEVEQLWQQPDAIQYNEIRNRLEQIRRNIEDEAHDKIFSRAKSLYAQRHQELRQLAAPDLPNARKLGLDVLSYPRVDSSTSTQPLVTIACCRIMGSPYGWVYKPSHGWMMPREVEGYISLQSLFMYMRSGRDFPDPHTEEFTLASTYPQALPPAKADPRLAAIINGLLVHNTGTHEAFLNIINRNSDLALLARKPSTDELEEAGKKGVKLLLVPIAWDALVFIVNEKNPQTALTQDQIRAIYANQIITWKELNGSNDKIVAFRREKNSGSQELFEELLLAGKPMTPLAGSDRYNKESLYAYGMGGPFNKLLNEKNGLAFSVFCYEHFMASSPFTKLLSVDGVEPSLTSIGNGNYPLRFQVYAVYRHDESPTSNTLRLLQWLISPEGQTVVREAGLLPLR